MAKHFKTGGRRRGTPNKITRAFREAVLVAYDAIGGDQAFSTWARENQTEFYRLAGRLIPLQVAHTSEAPQLVINIAPTPSLPAEREVTTLENDLRSSIGA